VVEEQQDETCPRCGKAVTPVDDPARPRVQVQRCEDCQITVVEGPAPAAAA
jgi:predicted RNA-binding Zn-ribbon protein involved in translation (DUF1610 family)